MVSKESRWIDSGNSPIRVKKSFPPAFLMSVFLGNGEDSQSLSLVYDFRNGEMVEKKARMYKKCQAAVQKMHSGLIFRDAVEPENNMAW